MDSTTLGNSGLSTERDSMLVEDADIGSSSR